MALQREGLNLGIVHWCLTRWIQSDALLEISAKMKGPAKMRGHNTCQWLMISTLQRFGRGCIYEYCKLLCQTQKQGRVAPVPRRNCGVGTQLQTHLCRAWGTHRVVQKYAYIQKKERRIYVLVVQQLVWPFKSRRVYPWKWMHTLKSY